MADEFGRSVVENEFAGGRAVDAELVLETADLDPRPLLDEQAAQAPPVGEFGLGAGEHQQDFAAAVGDEALDAVDVPLAFGVLIADGLHRLQVTAGVRLGEHHRACVFAGAEFRHVFALYVLVGEGVDRLGDSLKPEHVHKPGVGARNDVVAGRENRAGHVETAEIVRQRAAHEPGAAEKIDREPHARRIRDRAVVVEDVADLVGLLGRRGDAVAADVSADGEGTLVVVDRVLGVFRREVVLFGELEILFEERRDLA